MPVEGYEHKHLWLYRLKFRYPWPLAPMLDPDWDEDGEWQWDVIERLQRGAGLCSVSPVDLVRSYGPGAAAAGWEAAEEHAKDAVRTGSVFLNNEAIARRLPERELRKKAYAEQMARWEAEQPQREAEKARRVAQEAAERAERAEVRRVWREQQAERDRLRAEHDAEWQQADAERRERQQGVEESVREQLREKEQARYDRLQADAKQRLKERATILSKQWQCKKCLSPAEISLHLGQYQLICRTCRDRALGDHATLVRMLAA